MAMEEWVLEAFWNELPIGKENAVNYPTLCVRWGVSERRVRRILHDLSIYDNGDDYILIRSAHNRGGFYRTDDADEIAAYRKECLNKGRSTFAPVRKCNRVLAGADLQINFENNLRSVRVNKGMRQGDVCQQMSKYDSSLDVFMLSKMENGVCMPTPYQTARLAQIYGCEPSELIGAEFVL